MNITTGEIVEMQRIMEMEERMRDKFIPVARDLTAQEVAQKQINLYSPCGCGSGKKFKFCCHKPAA